MWGRVPVARRTALADPRRLTIAALGIGVALGLIFFLEGLRTGMVVQISAYQDRVGADLFVGQAGFRNFLGDTSVIPASTAREVGAVPGVASADPITARYAVLDLHGRKQFAFVVAAEQGRTGGPWRLAEGRHVEADDEVVLDRTLAEQHGLRVGSEIAVIGRTVRVVGLSDETRSWMSSLVFVSPRAAAELFGSAGTVSYVLVRTADPGAVADEVTRRTGLTVLPAAELARNDRTLLGGIMATPISVMVLVAFAAGTMIVALTVYSAVVDRIREYGIAKAMGASRGRLFAVVLGQTAVLAGLGALVGFGVYQVGYRIVAAFRPQFWVSLTPASVAVVLGAAAAMALLAAVVPTLRVTRLDPATVYRG